MSKRGQTLQDARIAPFSYITHAAMAALHAYFERIDDAKLSTGLALYMGIAYLLSIEKRDGHHEHGIEKTREEIGEAGGLSANSVTRYAEHLVSAEVLQLEQQLAGGANIYIWRLVEPHLHSGDSVEAPHHPGEAVGGAPTQGCEASHQGGEALHQAGEAYIEEEGTKKTTEETPHRPPEGDDDVVRPIFDFWLAATERSSSTKFSEKRRRRTRARLSEDWTPEQLLRAIAGCAGSDWHMKRGRWAGREGGRRTELTMIFASGESVEDFIGRPALTGWLDLTTPRANVVESGRATGAWTAAKQTLAENLPDSTFKIWIAPLEAVGERDGKLVLLDTTNGGIGSWVMRRYRALILEATTDFDDLEIVDETQLELEAV